MLKESAIAAAIVLTGAYLSFVILVHSCELIVRPSVIIVFRHEMPVKNELSKQNIQDRFFGNDDPVARKILAGHAEKQGLKPPEDETVVSFVYCAKGWSISKTQWHTYDQMSLFLSSLPASATEETVRTRVIKSLPGVEQTSLRSIVHVAKSR